MEEDVKKCETLLGSERWVLGTQDKKALENLIKGYRDSENIMGNAVKENLELKKYIRELEEQIAKHVYFETTNPKEIEKNYIPKSKFREKIEELEEEIDKLADEASKSILENNQGKFDLVNKSANNISMQIQALQELMEDK